MLYFKNNLNDVTDELNRRLNYAEAALEAWEKVEIKKKKDGTEYQNLSRALENATVSDYIGLGNQIVIYFDVNHRSEKDSLTIFGYLDELPDSDPRKEAYKRQIIRQHYQLEPDEIREAIKAVKIAYYEREIPRLKEQLAIVEERYNEFHKKINEAMNIFNDLEYKSVNLKGAEYTTKSDLEYLITATR